MRRECFSFATRLNKKFFALGLYVIQLTERAVRKVENPYSCKTFPNFSMHISRSHNWLFGAFLVAAPNRYAACRAYDVLIDQHQTGPYAGFLILDLGEVVRWTRLPITY